MSCHSGHLAVSLVVFFPLVRDMLWLCCVVLFNFTNDYYDFASINTNDLCKLSLCIVCAIIVITVIYCYSVTASTVTQPH